MKKIILKMVFGAVFILGTANTFAQPGGQRKGQQPPTAAQLIKEMDANKDGKLAEDELKGPIKEDFTRIDTDKDGFLSLKELQEAPKPDRKRPEGKK
jgi:Ca2+-binding EF-hand superfamily protein